MATYSQYQQYPDLAEPLTSTPAIQTAPQLQSAQALQNVHASVPVQPSASATNGLTAIVIPPGTFAGQQLNVVMPNGQTVSVIVPEGVNPGMQVNVQYHQYGQPQPPVQVIPQEYQQLRANPVPQQVQQQNIQTVLANPALPPIPLANSPEQQDRRNAKVGWGLYMLGWLCCYFCPPDQGLLFASPCLWCAATLMYFCKPKEERVQLRQQKYVATCSAATLCLLIPFSVLLAIAAAQALH